MFDISPTEWTAIQLSLRVAVIATLVATPLGIGVAWLLARRDFWGKSFVDALIHLPLVLPPVVTGYLLLLTFGRRAWSAHGSPTISASSSHSAGPGRRWPAA